MTYNLTEKVSTEYFTNTFENYANKGLVLYEIIEEKRRLSEEMLENYRVLMDEHADNLIMLKPLDLLYNDEVFNSKRLSLISTMVFDIVTTCGSIVETDDLKERVKLFSKFKDLVESPYMKDYKKFIYGYWQHNTLCVIINL